MSSGRLNVGQTRIGEITATETLGPPTNGRNVITRITAEAIAITAMMDGTAEGTAAISATISAARTVMATSTATALDMDMDTETVGVR
jgi:hypothetical protein